MHINSYISVLVKICDTNALEIFNIIFKKLSNQHKFGESDDRFRIFSQIKRSLLL